MTTQEKLIRNKLSFLELAEYLKNVSEVCKVNGVSHQHFCDIKKAYEENGLDGLRAEEPSETMYEESGSSGDRRSRCPDGLRISGLWTSQGGQ
jgi:hypothetical protein